MANIDDRWSVSKKPLIMETFLGIIRVEYWRPDGRNCTSCMHFKSPTRQVVLQGIFASNTCSVWQRCLKISCLILVIMSSGRPRRLARSILLSMTGKIHSSVNTANPYMEHAVNLAVKPNSFLVLVSLHLTGSISTLTVGSLVTEWLL